MKKTPEIRFPEFSGEWVEKRLGKLTKIYDGTHQTPKYVNKGIPFFSVENITKNNFDNTKYISEETYEKEFNNKKIEKNDLLLTRIGDIGSVKYFEQSIKAGYYVSVALIKNSQKFNSKFLKFYIESPYFQKELYKRTLHIAFPKKINLNEIGKCSLNLPPTLAEQQKIADFLSSVDEKIEIVAKKIEELKKYKKGLLQKLLNVNDKGEPELRFEGFSGKWVEKRLGEISVCEDNKRIPLNEEERKIKKGIYPYWGSTKIMDYVNDYIFDGEYVLLSEDGGYFYDYKDKPIAFYVKGKFWANNHIHVLKIVNNNTKYIYYSLVHKNILAYIIGGTRSKLNQKDLKKIKLHLPPTLAEQEKIASFLSSIDEKIETNEKRLQALKEYKQGLLQKMFA